MTSPIRLPLVALALVATTSFATVPVGAQQATVNNANSGSGSAWQSTLSGATSIDGSTFDDGQLDVIESVNKYFNNIKHLRGRFAQTDARNRTLQGRFYVEWPGRFRFDYARPSRLVIFSDGRYLRIEDLELKNTETYALNSTPFRIILAKNVNIQRDARVLRVAQSDKEVLLALRDKKEDTGVIQLRFGRGAEDTLNLSSWTITDAQGLDTRIDVSRLVVGEPANPKLFKPSRIAVPNQESRN